ncbi:MAG: hypothetical protein LUF30_03965, partial [Lachnospiraceae bacterium]|nr:hypothetical protein [Lachnospiraceae bacterium]
AEGVSGAERDSDSSALGSFTSNDSDDNDITAAAAYDSDDSVSGLVISESASGMNGIVVSSANVDFDDISITLDTDADGSDTCDFTGKGTAFAVYGSSNVTLSNSVIRTAGVATMTLFTDN